VIIWPSRNLLWIIVERITAADKVPVLEFKELRQITPH
jgi:hypothetical protein